MEHFRWVLRIALFALMLATGWLGAQTCVPEMLQRTLNNPDPIGYDHFGSSVAISGNLAVVGAYSDSPNGVRAAGTAYVFNARTGALQATLNNPSPKLADFFGSSVAISENLAVVGAYNADPGGVIGAGIVHVFNATTGLLLATLNNPAPVMNGTFGWSVAISGNLAVVGAAYHGRSGAIGSGTAYVFNATTGLLLATLDPAVAGSDKFGFSVAISGNLAVVGSWGDDPAGVVDAGGAYIFDATTGLLLATLNDPEPVRNGTFGWSVAISGNLAVVGAISDDSGGVLDAGRAYVFEVTTGTLEVTLNN
ncbi:FG-GAP repeat protein, partial [Candidatus Sumerlaeota bacterium]|nr:FG-GAP repeat protein [Candidatus Sumerlaeota bacterium]